MHKGSRARGVRKHTHSNDNGKNQRKKSSREDELLGTAGSLIDNKKHFENATGLLIHADNFSDFSLEDFVTFLSS